MNFTILFVPSGINKLNNIFDTMFTFYLYESHTFNFLKTVLWQGFQMTLLETQGRMELDQR